MKCRSCRRRTPLVAAMLDLAEVGPADYLIDLGCGDGRIAVVAAQRGARALGVDLDPTRIEEAATPARIAQVEARALFRRQDLFRTPIYEASVVTLYLLPRDQSAAAPAPADRIAAGRPDRQPRLRHGRLAARARRSSGPASFSGSCPPSAGGSWALTDATAARRCARDRAALPGGDRDARRRAAARRQPARPPLRFTVDLPGGARTFHALVEDGAILPDPAGPAGSPGGWRAVRTY